MAAMVRPAEASMLTGQLSAQAAKRVAKERVLIEKNPLYDLNIFVVWDPEHNHKCKGLVIGPPDTPYAYGLYLFDITFPNNYPLKPPAVKFCTNDGRVRMNPNLYVDGKVCLSILGTWQGPSWTAACTLRSVMLSIQSLLNENPIENEPGHENDKGKEAKNYNKCLSYENVKVAIHRMLTSPPKGFECLKTAMNYSFLRFYDKYVDILEGFKADTGKKLKGGFFGFESHFEPTSLLNKIADEKSRILGNKKLREEIAELHAEIKNHYKDIEDLTEEMKTGVGSNPRAGAGAKRPSEDKEKEDGDKKSKRKKK